ncbi:Hypothetical protein D9617_42g090420 [Elsinoe fawcettii]|nr:Hypothetical protein D9617_42g090420 [Elsinoe fawcettii]
MQRRPFEHTVSSFYKKLGLHNEAAQIVSSSREDLTDDRPVQVRYGRHAAGESVRLGKIRGTSKIRRVVGQGSDIPRNAEHATFDVQKSAYRSAQTSTEYGVVAFEDERRRILQRRALLTKLGEHDVPKEWAHWNSTNEVFKVLRSHLRASAWSTPALKGIPWDIMEYTGQDIRLLDENKETTSPEPWLSQSPAGLQHLETEIQEFVQWVEPTTKERQSRRAISNLVIQIVKDGTLGMDASLFGTETTGLATPSSDIDVRLFDPNSSLEVGPEEAGDLMNRLKRGIAEVATALSSHPDFEPESITLQLQPFALVQATHAPSGITIQVVAGPQTTHSRAFVLSCLERYQALKPLYYIMKIALSRRDLLLPYYGHLSSYGLFNLLVATLQARQTMYNLIMTPPSYPDDIPHTLFEVSKTINPASFFPSLWPQNYQGSPAPAVSSSPAFALLDTLYFLSKLDTYHYGISAKTGHLFPKRASPPKHLVLAAHTDKWQAGINNMARHIPWQNYILSLQDGADPANDLGRKASGWKHTQATLSHLSTQLQKAINLGPAPPLFLNPTTSSPDPPSSPSSPSPPLPNGSTPTSPFNNESSPFSASELRRETSLHSDTSRNPYAQQRWTLDSGLLTPRDIPRAVPAPLLRPIVGRVDIAWEAARTRMELFADGAFGWRQAGARREGETDEERYERREGYLRRLQVRKEGGNRSTRRRAAWLARREVVDGEGRDKRGNSGVGEGEKDAGEAGMEGADGGEKRRPDEVDEK